MKRFHIHIGVEKLEEAIRFYSALFGAAPVKTQSDYAKWLLDDPRLNFAISTRTKTTGLDHLGIQVDEEAELTELRERLKAADMTVVEEGETVCCYSRSDKSWVQDPAGIPWEAYRTMEDVQLFSNDTEQSETACCTPQRKGEAECCAPSEPTELLHIKGRQAVVERPIEFAETRGSPGGRMRVEIIQGAACMKINIQEPLTS